MVAIRRHCETGRQARLSNLDSHRTAWTCSGTRAEIECREVAKPDKLSGIGRSAEDRKTAAEAARNRVGRAEKDLPATAVPIFESP